MGGFVAIYNYLAFRLTAAPYHLPVTVVSLIFFAYLAGTFAAPRAGALASRFGRKAVLLTSIAIMIIGVLITLCANIILVLVGLVVCGLIGGAAWAGLREPGEPAESVAVPVPHAVLPPVPSIQALAANVAKHIGAEAVQNDAGVDDTRMPPAAHRG